MLRLEERFTCEDDAGRSYEVEVYREVSSRRTSDGIEEALGLRQAFLVEEASPRRVSATHEEGVFQIVEDGTILRRRG